MPERGVLTVTVPGTVEAWGRLLERFGTLGMGAVLEPAADLAQRRLHDHAVSCRTR